MESAEMKPSDFDGDTDSDSPSALFRYILAVGLAAFAVGLRFVILPATAGAKFTTFYPAVTMAFYLGGVGPGVATILLTALGAIVFFLPPYDTPELVDEAARQTVLYLIAAGFCGYFVTRMNQYRRASLFAQKALAKKEIDETAWHLALAVKGGRLRTWRFHPEDRRVSFSDQFAQHFGLPIGVHAISYDKIIDIIHPADRASVNDSLANSISEKADFIVEHRVVWPDGSEHWIYGHGQPTFAPDGALQCLDGVTVDITERKQSEMRYASSVATIKAAFASMKEAIVIADTNGNVIDTNHAFAPFLRARSAEQAPMTYSEFAKVIDLEDLDGEAVTDATNPFLQALHGIGGAYELKFRRRDSGETWYGSVSANPIMGSNNEIIGAVVTGMDTTERISLQQNLEEKVRQRTSELTSANRALIELSRHDALTGLHNRLAGNERLRSEYERMKRTKGNYSVLMLDIDHFKNINDCHGHAIGDSVLEIVADAMSENLREYDFIARWGGEEFLVLLPATEYEQACAVAEKLRAAVASRKHPVAGGVTVSVGVDVASPDDPNEDYVVMEADKGLYTAKNNGRNTIFGNGADNPTAHA